MKSESNQRAVDEYIAAHPNLRPDQTPGLVTYLASLRLEERQRHRAELLDMVDRQNRDIE